VISALFRHGQSSTGDISRDETRIEQTDRGRGLLLGAGREGRGVSCLRGRIKRRRRTFEKAFAPCLLTGMVFSPSVLTEGLWICIKFALSKFSETLLGTAEQSWDGGLFPATLVHLQLCHNLGFRVVLTIEPKFQY